MCGGATHRVMALRPASFKYRDPGDGVFTGDSEMREGFIADELQAVIPSAAEGTKGATTTCGQIQPQTVNPLPAIAVLTKALQELNTKVGSDRDPNWGPVTEPRT